MKAIEILQLARALIAQPHNWTQRAPARDCNGERVGVDDPQASQFCLTGALKRIEILNNLSVNDTELERANLILGIHLPRPARELAQFNDYWEHHEVLELLNKAINSLSKKETI